MCNLTLLHLCQASIENICIGLFLDSLFCSIDHLSIFMPTAHSVDLLYICLISCFNFTGLRDAQLAGETISKCVCESVARTD